MGGLTSLVSAAPQGKFFQPLPVVVAQPRAATSWTGVPVRLRTLERDGRRSAADGVAADFILPGRL